MQILALNSYHGGSHKAFVDGWIKHSIHNWILLTLPAYHWKWRMRHAAISFNEQLSQLASKNWDVVFCTDMLNLAEFNGLAPSYIQKLPKIIYFHENQLLYPDNNATERDYHYAFTNFISALTADEIWFNSDWHKNMFIRALENWLKKMPDFQPISAIDSLNKKSKTHYPGLDTDCYNFPHSERKKSPLTILWAARWENDKNPECFFNALDILIKKGVDFKLNMLGSSSEKTPSLFAKVKQKLNTYINHWGYIENRNDYLSVLADSDVIVSTAEHEFFGIAVLEAVSLGCIPLVPERLAYPETLSGLHDDSLDCFYNGTAQNLANKLEIIAHNIDNQKWLHHYQNKIKNITEQYKWTSRSKNMDDDLSCLVTNHRPG